jgi:hypothetical protein
MSPSLCISYQLPRLFFLSKLRALPMRAKLLNRAICSRFASYVPHLSLLYNHHCLNVTSIIMPFKPSLRLNTLVLRLAVHPASGLTIRGNTGTRLSLRLARLSISPSPSPGLSRVRWQQQSPASPPLLPSSTQTDHAISYFSLRSASPGSCPTQRC